MIWPVTLLAVLLGFWIANIPGALLGLLLGTVIDRHLAIPSWSVLRQRLSQQNTDYSAEHCQFMLLGYLAKLNGRVLPVHIQQTRMEMQRLGLQGYRYQAAVTAFSQGKQAQLSDMRSALRASFKGEAAELLLASAWRLVWAERKVSAEQRKALATCAQWVGVRAQRLAELEQQARPAPPQRLGIKQTEIGKALQLLGLQAPVRDFKQVQKRYRRLLSENHPDKLIGAGATEKEVQRANDKTQALHNAYAILRRYYRN